MRHYDDWLIWNSYFSSLIVTGRTVAKPASRVKLLFAVLFSNITSKHAVIKSATNISTYYNIGKYNIQHTIRDNINCNTASNTSLVLSHVNFFLHTHCGYFNTTKHIIYDLQLFDKFSTKSVGSTTDFRLCNWECTVLNFRMCLIIMSYEINRNVSSSIRMQRVILKLLRYFARRLARTS